MAILNQVSQVVFQKAPLVFQRAPITPMAFKTFLEQQGYTAPIELTPEEMTIKICTQMKNLGTLQWASETMKKKCAEYGFVVKGENKEEEAPVFEAGLVTVPEKWFEKKFIGLPVSAWLVIGGLISIIIPLIVRRRRKEEE